MGRQGRSGLTADFQSDAFVFFSATGDELVALC